MNNITTFLKVESIDSRCKGISFLFIATTNPAALYELAGLLYERQSPLLLLATTYPFPPTTSLSLAAAPIRHRGDVGHGRTHSPLRSDAGLDPRV